MANFIGLVYATLKSEGIDTAGMSTDEAVKKYNELQKEGGGKVGENEGTPAENRKLEEKGYTFKKSTKNGDQIVNKYQQDGETHIIAKAEDGSFVVGYNYNEDKGTFENSAKFSSMKEAEQAFRKNNPNARLTEQNLSKGKKPSLVDTGKIDETIGKLEEGQNNKPNFEKITSYEDNTDIDWDKAEANEKINGDNAKNPKRTDKYGNPLVSDEAFQIGVEAGKNYLNYMTKYHDLNQLKRSNVFLGYMQEVVGNAITNNGFNPNQDTTYQDYNEIIGNILGEEVDLEQYEGRNGTGFTNRKYSGYSPN